MVGPEQSLALKAVHQADLPGLHARFLASYTGGSSGSTAAPDSATAAAADLTAATASHKPSAAVDREQQRFLADVPDDGYLLANVSYHLIEAGQLPLLRHLLMDPAWLETKLHALGAAPIVTDFRRYLLHDNNPDIKILLQVIFVWGGWGGVWWVSVGWGGWVGWYGVGEWVVCGWGWGWGSRFSWKASAVVQLAGCNSSGRPELGTAWHIVSREWTAQQLFKCGNIHQHTRFVLMVHRALCSHYSDYWHLERPSACMLCQPWLLVHGILCTGRAVCSPSRSRAVLFTAATVAQQRPLR